MKRRHDGAAKPIISARRIGNRFGDQVVHDHLDLDVIRGEILGIVGGSGSSLDHFQSPSGVAVDSRFGVFVSDSDANRIFRLVPNGG